MSNISPALANFTAEPTPRTAIKLAIADHVGAANLIDHDFVYELGKAYRQLELLQSWKDAKLLADLYVGDGNTSDEDQTRYKSCELAARKALSNS